MRKLYNHNLKKHMPVKYSIHHQPHNAHSLNNSMDHLNITSSGYGITRKHHEHSKKIKPLKFKM